MRTHMLSRAYRDVRAGGFMQPLSCLRAHEYLGPAVCGHSASID
jgi:hypothetical protein